MVKLLIVEDDLILCDAYRAKFKDSFDIHFALDSETGISQAKEWLPNIIVLDLYLSDKTNGVEVLKELKNDTRTAAVPVLVITNLPDMKEKVIGFGAYDCLMKADVDLNKIEQILGEMSEKR
jgi:DNA-binding response OmpR family regulator